MKELFCAAFTTLCQILFESRIKKMQKPHRYIVTFFLIYIALTGFSKLSAKEYDEYDDIIFLETLGDLNCLTNNQRREIIIKALEHRRDAVLCFKQVKYISESVGLLNESTPQELVAAAIAGLCTQPYGWSSVVNTLITFAFEHSWDIAQRWLDIQHNLNKGRHHVEMFEFYKFILDNG